MDKALIISVDAEGLTIIAIALIMILTIKAAVQIIKLITK